MTTTFRKETESAKATGQAAPSTPSWFLPAANAVAWLVFVGIALAVQPPIDPEAPVDTTSAMISLGLWTTMFASFFGLAQRSRWGYGGTGIGGFFLVGAAVTCFAAGHTGAWLVAQGMAGVGLATTGFASWRFGPSA